MHTTHRGTYLLTQSDTDLDGLMQCQTMRSTSTEPLFSWADLLYGWTTAKHAQRYLPFMAPDISLILHASSGIIIFGTITKIR